MLRLLGLSGVGLAATAASVTSNDIFALFQGNHVVRAEHLSADSLDYDEKAVPERQEVSMPPAIDVLGDLPDMLERALGNLTGRPEKEGKAAQPGGPDLGEMMKVLQALFEAVKSNDFMSNTTWLLGTVKNISVDSIKKGNAVLEAFVHDSRNATDRELRDLVVGLFNQFTNTTKTMDKRIEAAVNATKAALPESLDKVLASLDTSGASNEESQPALLMLMPENSSTAEVCHMSNIRLTDLGLVHTGLEKASKGLNGTKKMLPMMHDYLEKMRPDVAPRVEYLVELMLGTLATTTAMQASFVGKLLDQSTPVITSKLGCVLSSGSGRASLGLLAVAALLMVWREL